MKVSFNHKQNKEWSRMGPRAMFGQFMMEIAKKNKKLMLLSADLGRSSGLDRFKSMFPNQYISVGISEQNLIGVASGLSREGYIVFVTSFAPFLSMRASEHVRMNLGYMRHPVNLVALGSGVSMGYLGNSHFGLEDISIIRSIPNISISSPSDPGELKKILYDYSFNSRGPSYIRLTGVPGSPYVYKKNYNYKIGDPVKLSNGKELLILSTGSVTARALEAVEDLIKENQSIKLLNIHTLNPISKKLLTEIKKFKKILTIEEHSKIGGLFSIVSELNSTHDLKKTIHSISLPSKFGPTGNYEYLLNFHKLNKEKIKKKILKYL
jgi:transketolase